MWILGSPTQFKWRTRAHDEKHEEFIAYLHDELDRTNEVGEELEDQVC